MKVGLLIPSRGLIRSQTMEAVDHELLGRSYKAFFSHDRPLPDCFEYLGQCLLESNCEYGWFVEEDVVPPEGALDLMLEIKTDITAIHYPLRQGNKGTVARGQVQNQLVWTGLGCTLVHRKIFEKLDAPWFKVNKVLVAVHAGSSCKGYSLELRDRSGDYLYGGQDVYFGSRAKIAGFTVGEVQGVQARHLTQEERVAKAKDSNRSEKQIQHNRMAR